MKYRNELPKGYITTMSILKNPTKNKIIRKFNIITYLMNITLVICVILMVASPLIQAFIDL